MINYQKDFRLSEKEKDKRKKMKKIIYLYVSSSVYKFAVY